MTESKKKGIYLKPVSVEDLKNRVMNYMKKDKDFEQAIGILQDAEKEPQGTSKEKAKIINAKLMRAGFEIGLMLSFYQMGGTEGTTTEKTKIG